MDAVRRARAHIARETDDSKTALRLYHRIIEEHTYLIAEALPEIVETYKREGSMDGLDKALKAMLDDDPDMAPLVAYTAIVNNIGGIPIIDECVERYMLERNAALPVPGMRVLEPAAVMAVPELPQLGNAAPGVSGAIRHGAAALDHESLICGLCPESAAARRSAPRYFAS